MAGPPSSVRVARDLDVFDARRAARAFAEQLGFGRVDSEEVAIVASELASNILKYGVRGAIELEKVEERELGVGLRIVAADEGPPFRDLERALEDGCDESGPLDPMLIARRRGIGCGLGAVLRLTDRFALEPAPVGKRVAVVRFRKRPRRRAR